MFEQRRRTKIERTRNRLRVSVAAIFVLCCFSILIYRLWVLQVERYQGFSERADQNRISLVPIVPKRGNIYDRNGEVLARSYRDYTLEVVPGQIADIDAMIEAVGKIIPISPLDIRRFKQRMGANTRYTSIILRSNLTDEEAASFAVRSFKFPGVNIRARWVREYPQGESAAHLIGYIGRISERDYERIQEEELEGDYRGTDVIGKKGLELSYEKVLHGKPGWEQVEIAASGRPVRVLERTDPIPGDNLRLSIDIGLQRMVEGIFNDPENPQRGALVAIDPRNGQVLAYVSAPSFDPNLFVDGIDVENWRRLSDSPDHPLIDRPIYGTFPIGSTYKPFVALAALTLNARDAKTRIYDPGYFEFGNQRFRNAGGAVYGSIDMHRALVVSSDSYFFSLGPIIGVDALHDFAIQFGFGKQTGIDLPHEKKGVLPSRAWKQSAFKDPKQQTWFPGETISVAVGQGYNSFTMMQLAQATATLAANGVYTRPHIVNWLENPTQKRAEPVVSSPEYKIEMSQADINVVKRALAEVPTHGTARRVFQGANYESAGKTGTAQVFSLRGATYNARNLDKRLHDHALYMGFAPVDDPKIALAVIVENGGWGSTVAAPIARKVFDYWLDDDIQTRNRQSYTPNFLEMEGDATEAVSPDIKIPEAPTNIEEEDVIQPLPEILGNPIPSQQTRISRPAQSEKQSTQATTVTKTQNEGGLG
ncbi:Penicillin-binding protein 2 [Oligella ureolytica]|uniref:Peptidoglycan D,D-transpeptidase MrdA n=1 Tax=Oligella ureolytica TaxID=90244 RepID=A0A378XII7_9BURK|nr:penicillin-binding protein 2 [Oligella ureolytica]QPT39418.1 penicillin-binding protein 2 [Oligella ureolytica]SUA56090.1 Penicillin-binding protein 2 [Oligella ureolytica]